MKSNIKFSKKNHYIDGKWQAGTGKELLSFNPINQEVIWSGHVATEEEVNQALDTAYRARKWALVDFETRVRYLKRFAEIVEANRQKLAHLIALETGKPLWESQTEVTTVINKIDISIQAYKERNAEKKTPTADALACIRYKPQGVVVVLGAFNFPAHLSNGHIVPALLAGNTVIYKPSEYCPAVAALIMECWHESGIPAGVINCLQGDGALGHSLLQKDIQGVYFTGSFATGQKINRLFSDKPQVVLALEMGGNNPLVVDAVDDIEAAVYTTVLSTVITAGQRCTCARRLLLGKNSQADKFLARLIEVLNNLAVGAYTADPEPFMGPVISLNHAQHHLKAQQNLLKAGGDALLKMAIIEKNSALLSPGLIDMSHATTYYDEEIFAPLIQVYRYHDFAEAVNLANNTQYGLAAGLLSNNPQNYEYFFQHIRAGLINWNRPTTGAASSLPFGGVGCSGNNRPSAYFAADYCSYPIASMENPYLTKPAKLLPGIRMD